jgi:hypothetical protein
MESKSDLDEERQIRPRSTPSLGGQSSLLGPGKAGIKLLASPSLGTIRCYAVGRIHQLFERRQADGGRRVRGA